MPNSPYAIETFTGKYVDPTKITVDDVCLEDIAHSLAHTCRFGGHCGKFYSVGQHSCLVCHKATDGRKLEDCREDPVVRWALMHDAAEAYLIDLPAPIKNLPEMTYYRALEKSVMAIIAERFNLGVMPDEVKQIDLRMCRTEAQQLLKITDPEQWANFPDPYPEEISLVNSDDFEWVRTTFLDCAVALGIE